MAAGATGSVSPLVGIPTINGSVDPPNETGINSIVSSLDTLVSNRIPRPGSPTTNHGLVWNGGTWVSQFLVDANIAGGAAIAQSKLGAAEYIKVSQAGALSIPTATGTLLAPDTLFVRKGSAFAGWASTTATTRRFLPTQAGTYRVVATLSYSGSSGGFRLVTINKNSGGTFGVGAYSQTGVPSSSATQAVSIQSTCDVDLNGTTDYVEVFGYQDSGSAIAIATGFVFTNVTVHRLSS